MAGQLGRISETVRNSWNFLGIWLRGTCWFPGFCIVGTSRFLIILKRLQRGRREVGTSSRDVESLKESRSASWQGPADTASQAAEWVRGDWRELGYLCLILFFAP